MPSAHSRGTTPLVVGLNLGADQAFARAMKPLLEEHRIGALEWDVDSPWVLGRPRSRLPRWIERLLDLYAADGRLYGHSVWLSMLTARRTEREEEWIEWLAAECCKRPYRHVSEHLGFMAAGPYVVGTLLPLPHLAAAVDCGRERLGRLGAELGTKVGLENMAAALAPADALGQAALLEQILVPSDGFLLLDLHNLFTQAVNLDLDPFGLLDALPCGLVRQIHVSGGSWVDVGGTPFRFDGHNGPVPPEVFHLVTAALDRCPNVEVVIYERRPGTLRCDDDADELRSDYRRLVELVHAHRPMPAGGSPPGPEICESAVAVDSLTDRDQLASYQDALVEGLARGGSPRTQRDRLLAHPAARPLHDYVASFSLRCIAAMSLLVRRWQTTPAELAAAGLVPHE